MAYYCLVDDHDQLHALDGWLLNVVRRAYTERSKTLIKFGVKLTVPSQDELLSGSWFKAAGTTTVDTRMPSFFLAWRVARLKYERYGIGGISVPKDAYAYSA